MWYLSATGTQKAVKRALAKQIANMKQDSISQYGSFPAEQVVLAVEMLIHKQLEPMDVLRRTVGPSARQPIVRVQASGISLADEGVLNIKVETIKDFVEEQS